jgi:hypothetical protein
VPIGVMRSLKLPPAKTWLVALLAGAASACASATLDVTSPVTYEIRMATVAINDATRGDMSPAQAQKLEDAIAGELRRSSISVVEPTTPHATSVVGKVVRYRPGIRALRFVAGYGFGTGALDTRWQVIDERSQTPAACRIEGSVSLGTFGGSFDEVQRDIGRALARFLRGEIE